MESEGDVGTPNHRKIVLFAVDNIQNIGDELLLNVTGWLVREIAADCSVCNVQFLPNRRNLRAGGYFWSKRLSDAIRALAAPSGGNFRHRLDDVSYRIRYGRFFRDALQGADAAIFAVGMLKYTTQDHSYVFDLINRICTENGTPVLMSAMSVSERNDQDWRSRQLRHAVNRPCVKMVTTRDGESGLERLRREWIRRGDIETDSVGDPALWAPECYGVRKDPSAKVFGINVIRGDIFQDYCGGVTENQLMAAYEGLIAELDRRGISWRLFSNGAPCDQQFGERLLKAIGAPATRLLPRPESAKTLLAYIASFRAVFAGRLHACITSFALDVPVAGMLWDDKLRFVAESFGIARFFTESRDLSGEVLAQRLIAASETPQDAERRDALKGRMRSALARFLESVPVREGA